MTLKTDKSHLQLELEAIAADLRHAYSFLQHGTLVSEGQRNVGDLIARQVRQLEKLIAQEPKG